MTRGHSKQIARLEARVSPEVKALWQRAAKLEGRTLTDFVIASVQEAAYKVIEQHQKLQLNLEDSEAFIENFGRVRVEYITIPLSPKNVA